MATSPHDVLRHARSNDWSAKKLAEHFGPTMSVATAQKLLDGSAIIQNVQADGKFAVYHPGRQVG